LSVSVHRRCRQVRRQPGPAPVQPRSLRLRRRSEHRSDGGDQGQKSASKTPPPPRCPRSEDHGSRSIPVKDVAGALLFKAAAVLTKATTVDNRKPKLIGLEPTAIQVRASDPATPSTPTSTRPSGEGRRWSQRRKTGCLCRLSCRGGEREREAK
jgi:hypothetical protein